MSEATSPEIRFYHLQRQGPEGSLPLLLEKMLAAGFKGVVKCRDEEQLTTLDSVLWTYDPASFLPHGTPKTGFVDQQPVYLTTGDENPNGAAILILLDNAEWPEIEGFDRCLYMFDSRDQDILSLARGHWKRLKDEGRAPSYWQQRENGGWEQKA